MASKMDLVERVSYISSATKAKEEGGDYNGVKTPGEFEGGALRDGGAPNIWGRDYIGILIQYCAVGLIYGTLPGTVYPFLNNYLHMEGTQVVSARVLLNLPWSFKVVYGILSDCFPIFGYRRRPFMMIGWGVCFLMLLIMACMKAGKPYLLDPDFKKKLSEVPVDERPLHWNLDAPDNGGKFIIMMMLAAVGYVGADVAADAVVVELAQREPEAVRGTTQTTIYMMRTVFVTISGILTGFAFNGEDYGGDFDFSISFPQLMLILAICCLPVIPLTWFFIKEEKHPGVIFKDYIYEFWQLLQLRPMYQVIAYKFFSGVFENFTVTCADPMQETWAEATPLNDRILSIIGNGIFALTLFCTGKYGLHWNWRWMHFITVVIVTVMDSIVTLLTTWDVVRNQWFWLGVPVVENLPSGVGFIIATYVVVELAGEGNEGAVYGLVTTVSNLSSPFASTLTKNVDRGFKVTSDDIAEDTHEVRMDVTYVLIIRYVVNLLGLCFLPLLPKQKAETQELKRNGGKSKYLGAFTVFYVIFALCWSVMVNVMSIYPSTKCLKLVGGAGCKK
uniref:Transmembrane protein n=1 Tax=Globisporangium ultimum (strain ATCC 200006 / CBS 805.95 / DAOM BR144) TaxID=431595 RepID=K3W681_GLOUD